ncbi:hypothetical protein ACI3E1_06965 [Ligilactobacillus sp. LYQ139]|uniref:hypothetical protein n=1 Tax=Ligilactobacillus sp. LYQ139 TaxID=3378800 RepID=UPI0038539631
MTINEQLIKKFKHEYLTEDFANGILEAICPDVKMKDMIVGKLRTKIVNLFSSREDNLKIDNYNVGDLINWGEEKGQVITPISSNPKKHVKFTQSLSDDSFWDFTYSWQDTDGTQLGEVVGFADLVLQNQRTLIVRDFRARVSNLTRAGWQRLAKWLQNEGLKVTLRIVPKAGSLFKWTLMLPALGIIDGQVVCSVDTSAIS